jgi:hypothetical protein
MMHNQFIKNMRQIVRMFRHARMKISPFVYLMLIPTAALAVAPMPVAGPLVVTLPPDATEAQVQLALDRLPATGGEVVLPAGKIEVSRPIVLQRDYQTLRGAGATTVLFLADNANCPVIIMGEPVNHPTMTISHLCVSDLFIDGNRAHQQRELWQLSGEGSEIRNNGITVQDVNDSLVEHVTCAHCRSGGLVTTLGVRRLTVRDLTAFDSEFDGLACYQTMDSVFTKLYLHDNPGAGISLDLAFNHNVIDNAILTANDLGIFMRWSDGNQFRDISIRDSRNYGVFMAQVEELTARGPEFAPQTECADNSFTNLTADQCGNAAFRINDATCTNNVIIGAEFTNDLHGKLSLAHPDLATVR